MLTIGVKAVLLASDELSENTVKALTKTLYDGWIPCRQSLASLELGPRIKLGYRSTPVQRRIIRRTAWQQGRRSMIIELDIKSHLPLRSWY